MDFEHILKSVGEFGPYQKKLVYFYLIPTSTIFAFYCMNTFFMLSAPDAWCAVPQLEHLDSKVQHLLSRPPSPEAAHKLDQCRIYDIDYGAALSKYMNATQWGTISPTNFSLDLGSNVTTRTCDRWIFDKTNYDTTAVTYHNLVCEREKWASLILTAHGIGEVLGNPFFGVLADAFGRRPIFFFALLVAISSKLRFNKIYLLFQSHLSLGVTNHLHWTLHFRNIAVLKLGHCRYTFQSTIHHT